jgi:hypothetical protein
MNVSRLKKAGVAPHEKADSLLIDHESEKLVRTGKFVIVTRRALSSAQSLLVWLIFSKAPNIFAPINETTGRRNE